MNFGQVPLGVQGGTLKEQMKGLGDDPFTNQLTIILPFLFLVSKAKISPGAETPFGGCLRGGLSVCILFLGPRKNRSKTDTKNMVRLK